MDTHSQCNQCKEYKKLEHFRVISNHRMKVCNDCVNKNKLNYLNVKTGELVYFIQEFYSPIQQLPTDVKTWVQQHFSRVIHEMLAACMNIEDYKQAKIHTALI